jgi:1,4-alpha-glucan branching enzyme
VFRPAALALILTFLIVHCATDKSGPRRVGHGYRFELDIANAGGIEVIGSWNQWRHGEHKMHSWGTYYWLNIDLPPGRYEYIFMSPDGRINPPAGFETISDGFGGVNAVAVIE